MNDLKRALAIVLIAAPLASAADKRIDEAYGRALQQLEKGQTENAVKTMQKVAKDVPGPESQAALARIHERAGQLEEAALAAAAAVAAGGAGEGRSAALATLAALELRRSTGAEALKHAEEAVQAQATPQALAVLARAQARAGRTQAAMESADKAVAAGGTVAIAHAARAEALLAAGQAADAEAAARKAVELDMKSSPGHVMLANALLAQGKAAEAEAAARKATEVDPQSAEAFAVLGGAILAVDPNRWSDAIAQAQQGAFLNDKSPMVQLQVGRIFEAQGNTQQAALAYKKALETDPGFAPAQVANLQAMVAAGQVDQALAAAEGMKDRFAGSGDFQLTYGRLLLRKGDWAGAAGALEKAAAAMPRNAEAFARLGFAYQYTNRTADALNAYRKAVELAPTNVEYRTTYGLILGVNKQHDAGIAELNKVIATPGYKSADAYLNLGWLYRNTTPRRAEESVAAYRKALELDPGNEQAALGMAWAYSYLKNFDESIKAFEKARELAPELSADAYNGIAWAHFFKKDLATAESFLAKAKEAGRSDVRLAENIDRVRKGLEAKEREEAEPAPVPVVVQADAGTLSQILLSSAGVAAKCKAARDIVKFGGQGVSALIGALRDGNMDVRICAARALGAVGPPAASSRPHLLAAAESCKVAVAIPTAEDLKNDAKCNEFGNVVRDTVGKIR
jgi:tetratricopeptide (TPR) repeat protein